MDAPSQADIEHAAALLQYGVHGCGMSLPRFMDALQMPASQLRALLAAAPAGNLPTAAALAAAASSISAAGSSSGGGGGSGSGGSGGGGSGSGGSGGEPPDVDASSTGEPAHSREGGKARKRPNASLHQGSVAEAAQHLYKPWLLRDIQAVESAAAQISSQLCWSIPLAAMAAGELRQNADRLVVPWSASKIALHGGGPLALAAALSRLTFLLLACLESGGRRVHSSNSFVNRGIGLNGEPLPQHGYHRDSMKGTVKLRGASRAIQNCPLDSGALAALALATGLGSDAVEAAALVAALHFLTKDIDLSGCGPHCELVPSEYAYNFWDLAEVANMPCAVVDEKGDQVVDENGHPVFRRACEVAGHASGAARKRLRRAKASVLFAMLLASGKALPIMPTLGETTLEEMVHKFSEWQYYEDWEGGGGHNSNCMWRSAVVQRRSGNACNQLWFRYQGLMRLVEAAARMERGSLLVAAQRMDALLSSLRLTPCGLYEAFYPPSRDSTLPSRMDTFYCIMEARQLRSDTCRNNPIREEAWRCPLAFDRFMRALQLRIASSPGPQLREQQLPEDGQFEWMHTLAAQAYAELQCCPGTCVLPTWTGEWVRAPASQLAGGHLWAYAPAGAAAEEDGDEEMVYFY